MEGLIHNSKGRASVKKRDATFKERLLSRCKQRIKAERQTLIAKMRENVRAQWSLKARACFAAAAHRDSFARVRGGPGACTRRFAVSHSVCFVDGVLP